MGVRILKGGMLTTVQDLGRTGYQSQGFSVSGVMDVRSFKIANLLLDNPENEAVLEFTLMGPTLEFTSETIISITGGDFRPQINGKPAKMYTAIYMHRGDILTFGGARTGTRGYIAFSSYLDVPVVMGSRSTNIKCQIGGYKGRKLEDEDYIIKSPVRRIHRIKAASTIKETYTDEQLESMRDNCDNLRDLALIDILASTGMRVGELVLLNKDDISFDERECVVFGKGDKERMVYFDARTKIHLQNYLDSRSDSNEALFVSLKAPYNRMKIGGIELRLREMGKKLNIEKIHPHKFRRTLATVAIDKGMPIEQLQKLLGHQRIDTTLQYAMVKQSNVKIAHRKYIG